MRTQLLAGSLAVIFGLGFVACSDDDDTNPVCGDDVVTGAETCDGLDLVNNDCTTIDMGYTGGTLACNTLCNGWDVSGCTGGGSCGDNTAGGTETCDGPDLRSNDCTTIGQGYTGGTLACNATCDGWDTTGCTGGATCGDDTAEGTETCDGPDLDGQACDTIGMGFIGGTLACNATCDGWDTTGCTEPTCGDDTAEGNEVCDGVDLDSQACDTIGMGFIGGTLACNGTCDGWDTTGCTAPNCGDNTIEGNEICDGVDLDGNDCTTVPGTFTGGTLACNPTCDGWDYSLCTGGGPVCGDGNVDTGEDCDLSNLDGNDCTTVPGGFSAGTLSCTAACTFNTSLCTTAGTCGDGNVNTGEDCDLSNLNGQSCTTIPGGFTGGTLACTGTCAFDTSSCTGATSGCGNGTMEGFEQCDGADLGSAACTDIADFDGGTLSCSANCTLDYSACTNSVNPGWTCLNQWYDEVGSGGTAVCDCGCGILDPDCASATAADCDWCNDVGSCNGSVGCTDPNSIIDPTNNAICTAPTCGNAVIEGTEWCDGVDFGGHDCTTLGMGFGGGTLACSASCMYDTTGCTMPICGDNTADSGEDCDGTDLGPYFTGAADCASWGWTAGTISCTAGCGADFSACTGGVAPAGWTCIDSYYGDGYCDCGCGIVDSDCADATSGVCEYCGEPGACPDAGAACPANINPTDNSQCI